MPSGQSRASRIVGNIVNPVMGAVDVESVLERVDLDAVLSRVDINQLMERIDLNALMSRVDIDRLLERIDVDGIVQRVDVDALIARVDVESVVQRANVTGIMTSTATTGLAAARGRLAALDGAIATTARRLLRRPADDAPVPGAPTPAGPATRLLAYAIDTLVISMSFTIGMAVGAYLASVFLQRDIEPDAQALWWATLLTGYAILYGWASVALAGRTLGKSVLGLVVVRADGDPVGARAALVRAVVYPISFVLGLGLVGVVVGRRRRALHDCAAHTLVVYAPAASG